MIAKQKSGKSLIAKSLGVSRSIFYYRSKRLARDWDLKIKIEGPLGNHPSYGYRRVALHLKINKKRAQRVMRLFGLRAFRRRGRRPKKTYLSSSFYPNLLKTNYPERPNHIWVSDFTYIPFKQKFLYLATIMDLFTREIVGWSALTTHSTQLVIGALFPALSRNPRPEIFHLDNGKEYASWVFVRTLMRFGIHMSRSQKSSPWENEYQESFYSQFKVDLGDPHRFKNLGELVYEVHRLVWEYNHARIQSTLRMPPILFVKKCQKLVEKMS